MILISIFHDQNKKQNKNERGKEQGTKCKIVHHVLSNTWLSK